MAYTISEANLERQKLLRILAPVTDRLLDVLQLPSRIRCLDLGCGIGESTRHLARRLNNPSEVIGVELNSELIEVAREMALTQRTKVTFQKGDVTHLEFADQSFDFVFARYLLIHLPNPKDVLEEMLRVCKSGGVVAVQEPDFSQCCYPDSWAYERLSDLWGRLVPDALLARKLWSLFREVGYASANIHVDSLVETKGTEIKRVYRLTVEATGPALLEKGIISEQEFRELCDEMKRVEQGENILCLTNRIFSSWVRKA